MIDHLLTHIELFLTGPLRTNDDDVVGFVLTFRSQTLFKTGAKVITACDFSTESDLSALMDSLEVDPGQEVVIDIEARSVTSRAGTVPARVADGARHQLLEGSWDASSVLLEAGDAIDATAARLPYLTGFAG